MSPPSLTTARVVPTVAKRKDGGRGSGSYGLFTASVSPKRVTRGPFQGQSLQVLIHIGLW
jgi:hypothetical protein